MSDPACQQNQDKKRLEILDDDIQQEKRREMIFMDFLRKKSGDFQTERSHFICTVHGAGQSRRRRRRGVRAAQGH